MIENVEQLLEQLIWFSNPTRRIIDEDAPMIFYVSVVPELIRACKKYEVPIPIWLKEIVLLNEIRR